MQPSCYGATAINYRLKSEASITLHFQLFAQHYKSRPIQKAPQSVIKVATMRNTDDFRYTKETITKLTLLLSAKMNGIQRRTMVSP